MKSIIVFLLCTSVLYSQNEKVPDSLVFPEAYFGIYKGDLIITTNSGEMIIPMEFHLQATDSVNKYAYTLVYGENETRQERKYFLIAIDKSKGSYIIDEDNDIVLSATNVGNSLFSLFEVNDTILLTSEYFYKDSMDFEITVSMRKNAQESGNTSEEIPLVISYPITVVQKAHLIKQ